MKKLKDIPNGKKFILWKDCRIYKKIGPQSGYRSIVKPVVRNIEKFKPNIIQPVTLHNNCEVSEFLS